MTWLLTGKFRGVLLLFGSALALSYLIAAGATGEESDAVPPGKPIFADDFAGTDGAPPDSARWAIHGDRTFGVDIRDGRLHLYAAGGAEPGHAEPTALLPSPIADGRLEAAVVVPPAGGADGFYLTFGLRAPATLESAYVLVLFREPGGVLSWRLQKYVDRENTPLTPDLLLTNVVEHYRVRLEVVGNDIRGSVRSFRDGPIPEGEWDLRAADSELTAPGTARPNFTKLAGQQAGDAYVDNFRVFALERP
ncbi:MAG: hypothetical protein ACRELC_13020 [Gemmatimonadota bacterium]